PPTQNGGQPIPFGLPIWLTVAGSWGGAPLFQSLRAAGGHGPGASPLDPALLVTAVDGALGLLAAAGTDPAVLIALARADYVPADLPDGMLGRADAGSGRVLI